MNDDFLKAKDILKKYNQEHVLNFYDKLSEENKKKLVNQILSIDFEQINKLYENTKHEIQFGDAKIEPIDYLEKEKINSTDFEKYNEIGTDIIKQGKLAVVTMAGGQGTRLGHKGPKGTYDLGLESHKSIFEILCDTLKLAKNNYGTYIQWYIMTSEENNKQTEEFFEKNNYFGYDKDKIMFFKQGQLPMCDTKGKLILDEQGLIKEAADGHGGVFESMRKDAVIEDMKQKNIEWAFIGGVDNVLVKMVDPVLIGISISNNVPAAGKSVVKAGPKERVGVFCKRNGKPSVVEYTEITDEMAEAKNESGDLVFGESHILCNLFSVKAIDDISKKKLPYHSAFKKAKYIDENGKLIVPEKPNAYKFEAFLFDAFESLNDMAIMRVKREEEFAPVKNAEGVDSPETARKLYKNFHKI
ncbi:MAG: UDPGP type 1 family protein [Clostridia bacterium]|jgi:UDP-N-acetylglucosamine/UDP-N-acetylgalactosamine diphosphorylase|nr:uDP-N-acetylglucosamine pyrophosphorylase [Clostridium sp. CAG:571]HJJ06630.1 UDPGP type 1 family protein [Clostridiaceae bacterium]HJJ13871.1 UDPGP type 1 family protein [Clostridiaceae bacterium]